LLGLTYWISSKSHQTSSNYPYISEIQQELADTQKVLEELQTTPEYSKNIHVPNNIKKIVTGGPYKSNVIYKMVKDQAIQLVRLLK
jgi:hypothetical protein